MANRIKLNQFIQNEDGSIAIEAKESTKRQIMDMVNDPTQVPEEFRSAAGNWETIDWWNKKDKSGLDYVLFRTDVEVTDVHKALVAKILEPNEEAQAVLRLRQYRNYTNRKDMQFQVQNLIDGLVVEEDEDKRFANANILRSILDALGAAPLDGPGPEAKVEEVPEPAPEPEVEVPAEVTEETPVDEAPVEEVPDVPVEEAESMEDRGARLREEAQAQVFGTDGSEEEVEEAVAA